MPLCTLTDLHNDDKFINCNCILTHSQFSYDRMSKQCNLLCFIPNIGDGRIYKVGFRFCCGFLQLKHLFAAIIAIMEYEFERFCHLSVYSGSEGRTRGCPTCKFLFNVDLLNLLNCLNTAYNSVFDDIPTGDRYQRPPWTYGEHLGCWFYP